MIDLRPRLGYDDAAAASTKKTKKQSSIAIMSPATSVRLLLHPHGRDRLRRTCNSHSSAWVDYRDSITSSNGRRLVNLDLLIVEMTVIIRLETGGGIIRIIGS